MNARECVGSKRSDNAPPICCLHQDRCFRCCVRVDRGRCEGKHLIELYLSTTVKWKSMVSEVLDGYVTGFVIDHHNWRWWHDKSGRGYGYWMIVDNGAWGRFCRGEKRDPSEVFDEVVDICQRVEAFEHPIYQCLLPDIVGDWSATIRAAHAARRDDYPDLPWALVVQDDFSMAEVDEYFASWPDTKLFIGGGSYRFKVRAADMLHHGGYDMVHCGRISTQEGVIWANNHPAVVSVDNSTWSRAVLEAHYGGNVHLVALRRMNGLMNQRSLTDWLGGKNGTDSSKQGV